MIHHNDHIEFEFPIFADADRIIDKNGLEITQISNRCTPGEAIRWAKLFSHSYQAYTLMDGVKRLLLAGLDTPHAPSTHEEGASCIICDIDEFLASVFNEPKKPSAIITE